MTINSRDQFLIKGSAGQKKLVGEISVGGAKNEVLKVLAASILFCDYFRLTQVPAVADVDQIIELLGSLGGKFERVDGHDYLIDASGFNQSVLPAEISKKLRASIVLTGPLLARFGQVSFPYPGGCVIGKRPIDLFLSGFRKMGAVIHEDQENFIISTKDGKLHGAEIFFKNQSVTATETFLLAGVLAEGRTILKNCALEPEIESLGRWLNQNGAKITGLGTPTLSIEGGELLHGEGRVHQILPDRIEAGSFIILGVLAAKDLLVKNCQPEHLDSLLHLLRDMGASFEVGPDWVRVQGDKFEQLQAVDLKTHEYPGFPTDLQAPFAILLTQAFGQSYLFETIFEGRLSYLEILNRMGAKAKIIDPHRAIIDGPTPLFSREIESPDLRAGFAYILAGAIATGESIVHNVNYIDRGYEQIEKRLQAIGLSIERRSDTVC